MNPARNLILVGPTGAGKSRIGQRLAEHYRLRLLDADHEIERHTGATINTIFDCEGEAGFRAREKTMLAELLASDGMQDDGLLLATGGGVVLDADNRALLHARGFVVHLRVTPAQQLERLRHDRSRPLLARPDREQVLKDMDTMRGPLYAEVADLVFDTGTLGIDKAAHLLRSELDKHWHRQDLPEHPTA